MIYRSLVGAIALVALAAGSFPANSQGDGMPDAARRVALVVGVGDYDQAPDLVNPISDARAVAAELWTSGFEVIEILDPNVELLRASIKVMGERLEPGTQVTFFFAGHGIEVGGRNYLLGRNVDLTRGEDGALEAAISANEVVESLADSGARLSIVVLDACRNNPFETLARAGTGTDRGIFLSGQSSGGLARIDVQAQNEFLLAFATSPGAVAFDGPDGGNSPFAGALIETIREPELDVRTVFEVVRDEVSSATGGQQVPWIYEDMDTGFVFRTASYAPARGFGNAVDTLGRLPPTLVLEQSLWRDAVRSGKPEQYELYLSEYPQGTYAEASRAWLAATASGAVPVAADMGTGDGSTVTLAAGTRTPLTSLLSSDDLAGLTAIRLESRSDGLRFVGASGAGLGASVVVQAQDAGEVVIVTDAQVAGPQGRITLLDGAEERGYDLEVEFDTCDLVAGYPHDPNRVGRGARLELMRPRLAIEACRNAVARYPDSVRFKAVLGRAYRSAGDFDAARRWNDLAAAEDYSAALAAAGQMALLGQGGPRDLAASAAYFERSANLGDSWGLNALGEAYLFGQGVEPDPARGVDMIRRSAETGNDWAHTLMGRVYENGWGVPPSDETAITWYRRAAEMGDPSAKLELADAYRNGAGVARDPAEALHWIESAAGQGWAFAQARLGREYALGDLVPADPAAAASWYEVAADQGDPEGEYLLARAFLEGSGRPRDPEYAVALLRLSASKENVQALHLLGELHEEGRDVAKDLPFAQEMYQAAWDLGFPPAARRLAAAHARGYDGSIDGAAAVEVLSDMIAQTDDVWAIRDLAALFKAGEVVPRDPERSAALTLRAVAKENPFAFRDHARNLESGFGVAADPAQAFEFMERAAQAENAWARLDYARYLQDGLGTPADPVMSAVWLARAAALDDAGAAETAAQRAAELDADTLFAALGRLARISPSIILDERGADRTDSEAVFAAVVDVARSQR